ncbi:unnamed protein product [Leptosia nina]|uniref:Uncharacterized protein n=1 Tax=Leptosia nina TaxID=320188 RepID=A0AAV1IXT8_9NEOP
MDATDCGIGGSVSTKTTTCYKRGHGAGRRNEAPSTRPQAPSRRRPREAESGWRALRSRCDNAPATLATENRTKEEGGNCDCFRTERRERSYKVTVLPKLQYCRVVSRECCGADGAAYTSDAVERHLCSLRVPCDRERRTRAPPAAEPATAPAPAQPAPPPQPPPGPFIYNTTHRPDLTTRRSVRLRGFYASVRWHPTEILLPTYEEFPSSMVSDMK